MTGVNDVYLITLTLYVFYLHYQITEIKKENFTAIGIIDNYNIDVTNGLMTVPSQVTLNGPLITKGKTTNYAFSNNSDICNICPVNTDNTLNTNTGISMTSIGAVTFNNNVIIATGKLLQFGTTDKNNCITDGYTDGSSKKVLGIIGTGTSPNRVVHVWDNLDVDNILTVYGTTTLNNSVTIATGKSLTVGGTTTFNDNVTIATGKLLQFGTTDKNNCITDGYTDGSSKKVLGIIGTGTSPNRVVHVWDNLDVDNILTVYGTTTLNNSVTIATGKSLTVGGTTTFNDNVTIATGNIIGTGTWPNRMLYLWDIIKVPSAILLGGYMTYFCNLTGGDDTTINNSINTKLAWSSVREDINWDWDTGSAPINASFATTFTIGIKYKWDSSNQNRKAFWRVIVPRRQGDTMGCGTININIYFPQQSTKPSNATVNYYFTWSNNQGAMYCNGSGDFAIWNGVINDNQNKIVQRFCGADATNAWVGFNLPLANAVNGTYIGLCTVTGTSCNPF